VRLWLGTAPSDDIQEFAEQAGHAQALEERTLKLLAAHMSQAVAKLIRST
jgi:hypothetical protein